MCDGLPDLCVCTYVCVYVHVCVYDIVLLCTQTGRQRWSWEAPLVYSRLMNVAAASSPSGGRRCFAGIRSIVGRYEDGIVRAVNAHNGAQPGMCGVGRELLSCCYCVLCFSGCVLGGRMCACAKR